MLRGSRVFKMKREVPKSFTPAGTFSHSQIKSPVVTNQTKNSLLGMKELTLPLHKTTLPCFTSKTPQKYKKRAITRRNSFHLKLRNQVNEINRDYFMESVCVQFLFTT